MEKMTFREAQLLVIGSESERKVEYIALNSFQKFSIGDTMMVVEIRLDNPCVVAQMADGPECYIPVENLSEKVVDECIDVMREVAWQNDINNKEK